MNTGAVLLLIGVVGAIISIVGSIMLYIAKQKDDSSGGGGTNGGGSGGGDAGASKSSKATARADDPPATETITFKKNQAMWGYWLGLGGSIAALIFGAAGAYMVTRPVTAVQRRTTIPAARTEFTPLLR